jgi:hypothetical protein
MSTLGQKVVHVYVDHSCTVLDCRVKVCVTFVALARCSCVSACPKRDGGPADALACAPPLTRGSIRGSSGAGSPPVGAAGRTRR